MKLVTHQELEAIWQEAESKGIVRRHAVASAGVKAARVIADYFASLGEHAALGVLGAGDKGLCALSALIELRRLGWLTTAYLVDYPDDQVLKHFERVDGEILRFSQDPSHDVLRHAIADHPLVLDGLVDAFSQPNENAAKVLQSTIAELRQSGRYVVSLCMPSGVDGESGAVSENALWADLTIVPGAVGIGLARPEAMRAAGEVVHVPLGVEELDTWQAVHRYLIDGRMVSDALAQADFSADKRALLAVGSVNSAGRPLLAGKAAMRLGLTGVVLGVPSGLHTALAGHFPEADWVLLPNDLGVVNEDAAEVISEEIGKERVAACLLGVDMGEDEAVERFWERLLGKRRSSGLGFVPQAQEKSERSLNLPPLVVGSDGLRAIAAVKADMSNIPENSVLLADARFGKDGEAPRETAARLADEWRHVVVFWDEVTVVAHPDGRLGVIPYTLQRGHFNGREAVLGGAIVALLARGVPAWEAASSAAWLFASAFSRAAREIGWDGSVFAGDVVGYLPAVIADL